MAAIVVTFTPGKRQGPTVVHGTGQVYTSGGRQDMPTGRGAGVKAKGKPGFIRGKGWGINLSLGLPAIPGRVITKPGIGIPEVVPGPIVWIPKDADIKTVIGQPPAPNTKELQVAAQQAQAKQAAQVRPAGLVTRRPAQVVSCY